MDRTGGDQHLFCEAVDRWGDGVENLEAAEEDGDMSRVLAKRYESSGVVTETSRTALETKVATKCELVSLLMPYSLAVAVPHAITAS